jgi:DNA-sulfur modification-associated
VAPENLSFLIPDLRDAPLLRRSGEPYKGRFQIRNPQWIVNKDDLHATVSASIRDIVTAAENGLIWTDQTVQRGVKPEREGQVPVELPLSEGFPDPKSYIFSAEKAEAIAERLLSGDKLRLSPLVWNFRPGRFEVALDDVDGIEWLYLYRGRIYLPDGHHRHQGIVRAYRLWEETPDDFPAFDPDDEFTLDIYFMSRQDEAEYFFQKNWLPLSVERSKSFDLTEDDSLAVLAKLVIDKSDSLSGNVNRVTDRLSASNPQVVTLSTLREVMHHAVGESALTTRDIDDLSVQIAWFWDSLSHVRNELGHLEVEERRHSRKHSMGAQAVMMFGYAELLRLYLEQLETEEEGVVRARWLGLLRALDPGLEYTHSDWTGDFFDRKNPLWQEVGVLQLTKSGGQTVSNVRQTRDRVGLELVKRLEI